MNARSHPGMGLILSVSSVFNCSAAIGSTDIEIELELLVSDPKGGYDGSLSPDARYIASSSHRYTSWSLWIYDRWNKDWEQLTDEAGDDTEPSWSPSGDRIAFTSWRDDKKSIWIVDVNSKVLINMAPESVEPEYPAWSPDGNKIVYTAGQWKDRNFYVHDFLTGKTTPVLKDAGHVGACSFHPREESLICHTYQSGYGEIISVDLATGNVQELTVSGEWHYKPVVDPNAQFLAYTRIGDTDEIRIAALQGINKNSDRSIKVANGRWPTFAKAGRELFFHRLREGRSEVRILNRSTGEFSVVVDNEQNPGPASLSPDGNLVAYCSQYGSTPAIWIYNRTTKNRQKISLNDRPACFPSWSPDGRSLAMTILINEKWEIAVADVGDEQNLRILSKNRPDLRNLKQPISWSPDGKSIVFAAITAPYESNIFVVNVDQGKIRNVTHDNWYSEGPSWSPDGLVFMSTRGGDWTWGLYRMAVNEPDVFVLSEPNFVEKGNPHLFEDGSALWIEKNTCLSTNFITERLASGTIKYHHAHPGAQWATRSYDGDEIIFTINERRTEYWVAKLRPNNQVP